VLVGVAETKTNVYFCVSRTSLKWNYLEAPKDKPPNTSITHARRHSAVHMDNGTDKSMPGVKVSGGLMEDKRTVDGAEAGGRRGEISFPSLLP
jgi:hypothetical protein